jgi:AcrR family transcriptional regulator
VTDAKRRTLILEAAGRLFHHYGPFKTTVADIAKEAGVGVGTVYLEFRNKDAILGALSGTRHRRVLDATRSAWGDGRPAAEALARALTARFEAFLGCAGDGAHGADMFACACPAIEQAHRAFLEAERELFARLLTEAAERGELAIEDPLEDARALLYAYSAFAPPRLFEQRVEALRRDLVRLNQLVLRGLLPR